MASVDRREKTPFSTDYKNNYGSAGNNNNVVIHSPLGNMWHPGSPCTIYCLHGSDSSNVQVRGHCHRQRPEGVDVKARKKLIIASILCLFFMVAEIIGGILSNSLAIATDAAHLLTDFASFMISLFAIWLAGRPSTQRMSFGWYRAEVIGALASVVMIWVITAILVWLAVQRLISGDFEVDAKIMLITSVLAIIVNLIMGFQLQHSHSHGGSAPSGHSHTITSAEKSTKKTGKAAITTTEPKDTPTSTTTPERTRRQSCEQDGTCSLPVVRPIDRDVLVAESDLIKNKTTYNYQHSHNHAERGQELQQHTHKDIVPIESEVENINVRAAFIHVLGDVLQSIGVFVAALVIYFKPEWAIADPICTFVFSIIVLCTTFAIMKDALLVLMEGTPSYLHYAEVMEIFLGIEGVKRVHNLRIWALSINKVALSAHLAIAPGANPKKILQEATTAVHLKYNFFETTIQIEDFTPEMENCEQCNVPAI